jgi:GTP cyclohydrolase I
MNIYSPELDREIDWLKRVCGNDTVYAVPKNGLVIGLMAGLNLVQSPVNADIIFDDLADSGKTLEPYIEKTNKKIVVLYVKPHTPHKKRITYFEEREGWIDFPFEINEQNDQYDKEKTVTRLLEQLGENPNREGLLDTPKRVVKANKELFAGYDMELNFTVFDNESHVDQVVGLSDIEFYSTCEHHMLPFFGKAHIYYIPNKKICGISKLGRVLDKFAKRLQNQERIAKEVADFLEKELKPKGIAVVLDAKHFCMMSRGIGKQHSTMRTSDLRGAFRKDSAARQELFNLINSK